MEKFQLSIQNLNNLWSFIEVYAVFVPNLCGEKSVRRKYVWRKNDRSGYNMEDFDYRSILFDNGDIVHCVISMHNENISDEKKWICSL